MSNSELTRLIDSLGGLLAEVERELAQAEALGEALIKRADEVEKTRLDDMQRLRRMHNAEADPHRLRTVEQQYVAAALDRDRARRIGRYERDRKLRREEERQLTRGRLVALD